MKPAIFRSLILVLCGYLATAAYADNGYRDFFHSVPGKLDVQDQKRIYTALELKQSKDGRSFVQDDCDPAEFDVKLRDINNDGVPEVFVLGGNNCTSGNAGSSIWLFIRLKHKGYMMNCGFPAAAYKVLPQVSKGFPDIQFGGPAFCEPVWRWNGYTYTHYKNIPTAKGGCDHVR